MNFRLKPYENELWDILICAADYPPMEIRQICCEDSINNGYDIIFCGAGIGEGHIGPLLTTTDQKKKYNSIVKKSKNCSIFIPSGSSVISNTMISSMLSNDVIYHYSKIKNPLCLNKEILYSVDLNQILSIKEI